MNDASSWMDRLFDAAVAALARPRRIPYAELLRGAHLGFDADLARRILADHTSLVFLNRLWDCQRIDGVPVGPARVPQRIWDLAGGSDTLAELHRQLLERTGQRFPDSAELDLHLMLWASSVAARGGPGGEEAPLAQAIGSVSLTVALAEDGLEVAVDASVDGQFTVTLHWSDGASFTFTTPQLRSGDSYAAIHPVPHSALPESAAISSAKEPS